MPDKLEKKNWYDGRIYAKLIDTQPIPFRFKILKYLDKNSTVLDVGCGTGGFTIEMAKVCKKVIGIDISKKQIEQARKYTKDTSFTNVVFKHSNAINISNEFNTNFDFAVFTLMLHEINHDNRLALLKEIGKVANAFIIFEYNIPHPYNLWGIGSRIIEFLAGWNHFSNFIDFKKRGGINNILEESGFQITNEKINSKNIFKIVTANKIKYEI